MKPIYIYTSSAISTQDSFQGADFLDNLKAIEENSELITPNYRDFIKPMLMRRMGKATRMSIACAFNAMRSLDIEQPESIIVGTGLGALTDTEKFLSASTTTEEKILPPTAFIQSGHNTIAGQIALLLKNDLYNMTHVQREVSFEYAMLDGMLNVEEGKNNVLVGAYDELTDSVKDLSVRFKLDDRIKNQLSEGASFFVVGSEKSKASIQIKAIGILNFTSIDETILAFLRSNEVIDEQSVKAFYGFNLQPKIKLALPFEAICFTDYCGRYFTSSAFGLHMAITHLESKAQIDNYALVVNVVNHNKVALTLLKRV